MKYKIEINENQDEDFVVYAKRNSPLLETLRQTLGGDGTVYGYAEEETVKLEAEETYCFYTQGGKVIARTADREWMVRERIYEIEQIFGESFVKINQSCLVNVSKIKKFGASFGGGLWVLLENGYQDYVSRRQMKEVKNRMGL